ACLLEHLSQAGRTRRDRRPYCTVPAHVTGSALDLWPSRPARRIGAATTELSDGLFRYILAMSLRHQIPLVLLTVAVFLLEVVPLELQRRVVNDAVKDRSYRTIVMLCATYVAAVLVQGAAKLGVNIYRSWVGERIKRDLRRRVSATAANAALPAAETQGT